MEHTTVMHLTSDMCFYIFIIFTYDLELTYYKVITSSENITVSLHVDSKVLLVHINILLNTELVQRMTTMYVKILN